MTEQTEVVITTPATEPETEVETEVEEFEVTKEWLEQLFAESNARQAALAEAIQSLQAPMLAISERLTTMENRVPENLTGLLSEQQAQMTAMMREMMETARALLIQPAPEPVIINPTEPGVEAVPVEVETPISEPARRRLRRI